MNDNFADFFIKKHRVKSQKEIDAEDRAQRNLSEYQQKIIDRHMKESGADYEGENTYGPD